jgi:hypothetical protein
MLPPSGIWRRMWTDVSEERIASRVENQASKKPAHSRWLGLAYIPEDGNILNYSCENLKSYKFIHNSIITSSLLYKTAC